MPASVVLPDAELLVRKYLVSSSSASVTALVGTDTNGEVRVYTVVPKDAPSTPFLRMFRLGGTPAARRNVDAVTIQLDAYGGTKAQARELLATVYERLEALEGADVAGAAGYVQGVTPGAFRYLPDPDLLTSTSTARERYVGSVDLVVRQDRS